MSEALEKWPMELFSRLLPRIYQIDVCHLTGMQFFQAIRINQYVDF